jgi:hypothetical protein
LKYLKEGDKELALQALGMTIAFLEQALLSDVTIATAEFEIYTPETQCQFEYMVLDSQAL